MFALANENLYLKKYLHISDMIVNRKYQVYKMKCIMTKKYGKKIMVELEEGQVILPYRYISFFNEDKISQINNAIESNKSLVYMESHGKVGSTFNIKFIEENI